MGRLEIDPIRPEDRPALQAWFEGVSPESRYARFLSHIGDLPAALWHYLTVVDGEDHVAFLARLGGAIVGVARWIRLQPDQAEVAVLVDDAHQRSGIGRALCDALMRNARAHGIARVHADVLPENRAIRRLLVRPPLRLVTDTGGELDLVLEC